MSIEPDSTYPNMWRVRRPNGTLSDMVNRTRAKDAAELMVLASNLKVCRTPSEDSSSRHRARKQGCVRRRPSSTRWQSPGGNDPSCLRARARESPQNNELSSTTLPLGLALWGFDSPKHKLTQPRFGVCNGSSSFEDGRGGLGPVANAPFPSPLIEPDVPISGIRLSDWLRHKAFGCAR